MIAGKGAFPINPNKATGFDASAAPSQLTWCRALIMPVGPMLEESPSSDHRRAVDGWVCLLMVAVGDR